MARQGLTDVQIAKNMGIANSTLNVWKKRYPIISDALKKGKVVIDKEIENSLVKNAMGFYYEEEKTFIKEVDGKRTMTKEIYKKYARPDTTAIIIWLKNRMPSEWSDNPTDLGREEQVARIAKLKAQTETIKGIKSDIEDTKKLHDLVFGN